MSVWIDFKALRQKLTFHDLFKRYGLELRIPPGKKQVTCPCPLPNHGGERKNPTFSANLERNIFQCFSCKAKGDLLAFATYMDGRDPENPQELRITALALANEAGTAQRGEREEKTDKKPKSKALINAPLDFELKGLDPAHEYLSGKRKLLSATIQAFGLGFCSRGYLKDRVAIPIRNPEGHLVGYAGRIVNDALITGENPKYLFPGTRSRNGVTYEFRKNLLIYNAHRLKAPLDELIVVKGFPSVWWLTQHGFPNCVAVMGSSLSEEQAVIVRSLLGSGGTATILFDGDKAGKQGIELARTLLEPHVRVRVIALREDEQPTDKTGEELQTLLRHEIPAGIGGVSPREHICTLIHEFPCLRGLNITPENWDADEFDRRSGKFSSGELSIAQFILGVWNPRTAWKCGKFDFIEAAARLDDEHRRPIIDWFSDPWWP